MMKLGGIKILDPLSKYYDYVASLPKGGGTGTGAGVMKINALFFKIKFLILMRKVNFTNLIFLC